jgi:hypothetical protein
MPRTTALREATPARVAKIDDAHLCALLLYIGGYSTEQERIEDRFGAIQAAARAIVTSRPLPTAFSELLNRPSIFTSVVTTQQEAVEKALESADDDRDRRRVREEARLLRAILANDDKVVPDAISGDLFDVLVWTCLDASLLGAAVMYELLQGGRR